MVHFKHFGCWPSILTYVLPVLPGTREAAFVYAISSASIALAVTQACSSGELEKCGCDHNVHGVSPEGRPQIFTLALLWLHFTLPWHLSRHVCPKELDKIIICSLMSLYYIYVTGIYPGSSILLFLYTLNLMLGGDHTDPDHTLSSCRVPVVWLLRQHCLWCCILPVICGCEGEKQRFLIK